MDYFSIILAISGFVVGLRAVTNESKIGYPIRQLIVKVFPEWIQKPLITCSFCMPSVWGSLIYLIMIDTDLPTEDIALGWAFCCVCASGLAGFGWEVITALMKYNDQCP